MMEYTIRFWRAWNEGALPFLNFPAEEGRVHMHVHGEVHRTQVLFFLFSFLVILHWEWRLDVCIYFLFSIFSMLLGDSSCE